MANPSEYAEAGVDYGKIAPFKRAMQAVGRRTLEFPRRHHVVVEPMAHGATYYFTGSFAHAWVQTTEGLGNKNWIAEWMRLFAGTGRSYYQGIGIDTALMAVNDVIAQGAMPVVYTDEVAAGDSAWFEDEPRSRDLAEGFFEVCQQVGMALPAGESPALRYLIKAEPPVTSCPSLSGCCTGIIAPSHLAVTGKKLQPGDRILGAASSGLHANGISLVIKRALALPDKFLTRLPNGNTLGDEALIPTRSYVALVEALQIADVDIHALLPGTGGGIAKLAADPRPFTYRISRWVQVPILFRYLRELGVSIEDCLTTFNWGIGYYIFVPPAAVETGIAEGQRAGYELVDLGIVESGERCVVFEPEHLTLPPPGD
ncbi:MAG: phosphoribosylformylglycinamidine cyclo-ligase [Parcubacteria group bacterium Gr01-1014_31]|nr:MAG: phosphoribosylformylglycinamidine cyclo-ligase [Parcubacteria group bacterium Gr01-1014_31]